MAFCRTAEFDKSDILAFDGEAYVAIQSDKLRFVPVGPVEIYSDIGTGVALNKNLSIEESLEFAAKFSKECKKEIEYF